MAVFESSIHATVLLLYSVLSSLLCCSCLDVIGAHSVNNKVQCQRLCWYHSHCTAFSYHDGGPGTDCLLHAGRYQETSSKADGWLTEKAGKGSLANACASRPCPQTHVCVAVGSTLAQHHCLALRVVDCGAPQPWVNRTVFHWSGNRAGDVAEMTCDPDYVVSPRDAELPLLVCDETGQWVTKSPVAEFTCQQAQFRNVTTPFSERLPWNISEGWEACVIGSYKADYLGLDFSFLESEVRSIHEAEDIELFFAIGSRNMVAWNQKSGGDWPSEFRRILTDASPINETDHFRVSFRLLSGNVLNVTVDGVQYYRLDLSDVVDLSVVRYLANFNDDVIQFLSLTSAAACQQEWND